MNDHGHPPFNQSQQDGGQPQPAGGPDRYHPSPLPGQFSPVRSHMRPSSPVSTLPAQKTSFPSGPRIAPLHSEMPGPSLNKARRSSRPWKRSNSVRITMRIRQRSRRWKREHPQMNRVISGLLIALALLMVFVVISGSAYGYTYYQSQLPRLQEMANQSMTQSTRIYDRNGQLLFEAYDARKDAANPGRRTPVAYNDIPRVLQDALVAIEDSTFWNNTGVSPEGIVRAAIASLQHTQIQGASTLAQQLVKNLTGQREISLARKIPEAALAIGLTQQYPKWKILEMYFNVSPFGPLDLGVESAVEEYFHLMPQCSIDFQKHLRQCTPGVKFLNKVVDKKCQNKLATCQDDPLLGLARASLLAGLPNSTSYYPSGGETGKKLSLQRQKLVLQRMIDLHMYVEGIGYVTPEVAKQAEELTAKMEFTRYSNPKRAPHFVDWIINQVETILGNGDPTQGVFPFLTGGFNIRTTVSLELEEYVERVVQHHLSATPSATQDGAPLNSDAHNVHSAAVVVMNAHTGEILAMLGSADYNDPDPRVGGQYNIADSPPPGNGKAAGRPTGSSFKPFVYATALEMGWYPGMIIPDYHTNFPNVGQGVGTPAAQSEYQIKDGTYMYAPPDFDWQGRWNFALHSDLYHDASSVTVRTSLQESLNVGAIKAMKFAGPKNVENMAHRLGLNEITAKGEGISWALGTQNATVLQMTSAYQTFANSGKRIPPQGILDIWDNYGHSLYSYDPANPPGYQVISPQVSFLLTSILRDEGARAKEFQDYHTLSFADIDPTCITNAECGYQVASKTGTTDSFKDTWTMGYTPNIVVGTWTGNANNEPMNNILGISGAGTIWHSVIKTASGYCNLTNVYILGVDNNVPCPSDNLAQKLGIGQDKQFTQPEGIIKVATSTTDGLKATFGGNYDYMIDGQQPLQGGNVINFPWFRR